jgi:hypothetical protein
MLLIVADAAPKYLFLTQFITACVFGVEKIPYPTPSKTRLKIIT